MSGRRVSGRVETEKDSTTPSGSPPEGAPLSVVSKTDETTPDFRASTTVDASKPIQSGTDSPDVSQEKKETPAQDDKQPTVEDEDTIDLNDPQETESSDGECCKKRPKPQHLYTIPYNHDDPKDEKHLLVLQQTKKFFWLFGSLAYHFISLSIPTTFPVIISGRVSEGLPMLNRAQTFPLSVNKLTPESRDKAWLTADIIPYSKTEQKRVCYPSLEPWRPRDGKRKLDKELETTIRRLKTRDGFLGSNATLREKWSIKFEAANRRMEGTDMSSVPTIMVVAWDENDRDYSAEDEELWIQACKDIVAFLRDHGAAYFGVEIIYWDRLDYQVVT
ncbi:hypothetical protein K449DRAFT_460149 [Hypoxylon sp. EC38]|nr:hypothetical protein K449DRAFT_460149 [Hypoxylon sp. EC38]